jgi:hypothetical protein
LKVYRDKQLKSDAFFMIKNKECLAEIKKMTKDFTELPKTTNKVEQKVNILKNLEDYYLLDGSNESNNIKVIDLSSIDNSKLTQ